MCAREFVFVNVACALEVSIILELYTKNVPPMYRAHLFLFCT